MIITLIILSIVMCTVAEASLRDTLESLLDLMEDMLELLGVSGGDGFLAKSIFLASTASG